MNVLGIETSCDETAAAVVAGGRTIRSSTVHTQVAAHRPHGGVVPEVASRQHGEHLPRVIGAALAHSGLAWPDLDAVAVTYGPGLAGALLIGLAAAKALALRIDRPLIGINHLEAHLYSVFLAPGAPRFADACPLLALIASGGHTCLVRASALGAYARLGQTLDDAAGEAFDKGAKLLGLGYPGGPEVDRLAAAGRADAIRFPRTRVGLRAFTGGLDPALCFSFSGLKTALAYYLRAHPEAGRGAALPDTATAYQEAIVDVLVGGVARALRRGRVRTVAAAGGVALNSRLRARLQALAHGAGVRLLLPPAALCADNAAMVAGLAGAGRGVSGEAAWLLDATPNLPIG